jgi:hypothetical protein
MESTDWPKIRKSVRFEKNVATLGFFAFFELEDAQPTCVLGCVISL